MVSTLACNVVMVTFLQRFFYGGLEVESPQTLHRIASSLGSQGNLGYQDFLQVEQASDVFDSIGAAMVNRGQSAFVGEHVYWVDAAWASVSFAALIGGSPMKGGRFFDERDNSPGAPKVAVVNQTTWEKFRPGEPFRNGEQIYVKSNAFEVIGVVENDFPYLDSMVNVAVWIPARQNPEQWQFELDDYQEYQVLARLDPDKRFIADQQVDIALADIDKRLGFAYSADVLSETEFRIKRNPGMHRLFVALAVVTGFLFALGAINQLLMLVTRSVAMAGDLKIMVALGAKAKHVLSRFAYGFSILLGIAFAGVVFCSIAAIKLYNSLWGGEFGEIALTRLLEPMSLAVLAGLTLLLVALHLGFPLLTYLFRGDSLLLRDRAAGSRFSVKNKLSLGGVALQIALVVFTVFGSAAFLQSLRREGAVNGTPFDNRMVFVEFALASKETEYGPGHRSRLDTIKAGLMKLGGIDSMGTSGGLPLQQSGWTRALIEGQPLEKNPEWIAFDFVTPGYFDTVGLNFIEGQDFTHEQASTWPHSVFVINQAYADKYFPGEQALGRKITPWDGNGYFPISGIVENAVFTMDGDTKPCIYIPFYQNRQILNIRLSDPSLVGPFVKKVEAEIRKIDPEVIVVTVDTIDTLWKKALAAPKLGLYVLTSLSLIGLVLSLSGAFGYQTYMMLLRQREFAVRHALGQRSTVIFWSEVLRGSKLVLLGLICGAVAFYGGARYFGAYFFGIDLSLLSACGVSIGLLVGFVVVLAAASATSSKPKLAILMRE